MPRVEIGIGAVIAAIAGLGWASSTPVNVALLALGVVLILQGVYDVYYKPNVRLDATVARWLKPRCWTIIHDQPSTDSESQTNGKPYFAIWVRDDAGRRLMISRHRDQKGILAFTAPIDLDDDTLREVAQKLSPVDQQRLYEDLHVLLASMHLGYGTEHFTRMWVQHALPIDEHLSAHAVDLKAKEVVDGVAAARSMIRKAVR